MTHTRPAGTLFHPMRERRGEGGPLVPATPDLKKPEYVIISPGMNAVMPENSAVAVWRRAIQPESGDLPPAEARAMLRLKLSAQDLDRADELAEKARHAPLSPREERELEDYLAIGSALEFLKSKARLSLRSAGETD